MNKLRTSAGKTAGLRESDGLVPFGDTNIALTSPEDLLSATTIVSGLAICIYVLSNEAPVFWRYVLPLARSLQTGTSSDIRIYNLDSHFDDLPPVGAIAVIEIDAESLTLSKLKSALKLETSAFLRDLVEDPTRRIVFYLHNIHATKEAIAPWMTNFVEAKFGPHGQRAARTEENTRIVMSGVYLDDGTGRKRAITPLVAVRVSVCAFDI